MKPNYSFILLVAFINYGQYQIAGGVIKDQHKDFRAAPLDVEEAEEQSQELIAKWFYAITVGDLEETIKIAKFVDVNIRDTNGRTALIWATDWEHESIVKFLLSTPHIKIDIRDYNGNNALDLALAQKQNNIAKLIQNHIAERENYKLLLDRWFEAAEKDILETVCELIGKVDINAQDKHGYTALIKACENNHKNIVQLLLQVSGTTHSGQAHNPIDVNLREEERGNTALIMASQNGRTDIVKLLLAIKNIDVNIQRDSGDTALLRATERGHVDIVKLLLQTPDINLNIANNDGRTARYYAKDWSGMLALLARKIDKLIAQVMQAIEDNDAITFKKRIAQLEDKTIADKEHIFLDKAFSRNRYHVALFLLLRSNNPQEALTRFPFEHVNPTSDLFKLCLEMAFNKSPITYLCAYCSKDGCVEICGRCKKVYYCSNKCQKAHWKTHKKSCIPNFESHS